MASSFGFSSFICSTFPMQALSHRKKMKAKNMSYCHIFPQGEM
jgi:hypothetical protein